MIRYWIITEQSLRLTYATSADLVASFPIKRQTSPHWWRYFLVLRVSGKHQNRLYSRKLIYSIWIQLCWNWDEHETIKGHWLPNDRKLVFRLQHDFHCYINAWPFCAWTPKVISHPFEAELYAGYSSLVLEVVFRLNAHFHPEAINGCSPYPSLRPHVTWLEILQKTWAHFMSRGIWEIQVHSHKLWLMIKCCMETEVCVLIPAEKNLFVIDSGKSQVKDCRNVFWALHLFWKWSASASVDGNLYVWDLSKWHVETKALQKGELFCVAKGIKSGMKMGQYLWY